MAKVDIQLGLNSKQVKTGLDELRRELGKFREQTSRDIQGGIVRGMHYLNGALGLVRSTLSGLSGMVESVFKPSANMETLQTQFGALLGSQEKAITLLEKLRTLNIESPLQLEDFAAGAKALLGVGMSADETAVALDKLSNISMGNTQNFDSLVRAFSQVSSAGRLMGQEVLQFVNAGFNPLAQISLQTGESMAALKERMEDGQISFKEVGNAITFATSKGGLFNEMNKQVAATFEGRINKLADAWTQLKVAIGTPIMNAVKPLIDEITARVERIKGSASLASTEFGKWITLIRESALAGRGWDAVWLGLQEGALRTKIYIKNALKEALEDMPSMFKTAKTISDGIGAAYDFTTERIAYATAKQIARNKGGAEGAQDLEDLEQTMADKYRWKGPPMTDQQRLVQLQKERMQMETENANNQKVKDSREAGKGPSIFSRMGDLTGPAMAAARKAAENQARADKEWDEAGKRLTENRKKAMQQAEEEERMKPRRETIADSLQRIAGGGGSYTKIYDPTVEVAKNTKRANEILDAIYFKDETPKWQ
jgi:tape measure domain-containing protein